MSILRFQSEIYSIATSGTIQLIFKVAMNCGQSRLNNFQQFVAEAERLGNAFSDRNFYYDESPETPGLMALFHSINGNHKTHFKLIFDSKKF